jgi:hypothetical protein
MSFASPPKHAVDPWLSSMKSSTKGQDQRFKANLNRVLQVCRANQCETGGAQFPEANFQRNLKLPIFKFLEFGA